MMRNRHPGRKLLCVFALVTGLALPAGAAPAETPDQSKWDGQKRQVVLANGQTLRYIEMGDRNAPPVLLLHGISDTSRSFSLLAPYLPGMRLLVPDQRGHGRSDRPECCYAIADMAWDAKLFLDALKVERAHVAGHSLGSMVAQVFAATWPDRVNKLVLIASTPGPAFTRGDWLWTEAHKLQGLSQAVGEVQSAYAEQNDACFARGAAMPAGVRPVDPYGNFTALILLPYTSSLRLTGMSVGPGKRWMTPMRSPKRTRRTITHSAA